MEASGDSEKKVSAVDDSLADDRSAAEGQVYRSQEARMDLNRERRYGEFEIKHPRELLAMLASMLTIWSSPKARLVAVAISQHDVFLQFHRSGK